MMAFQDKLCPLKFKPFSVKKTSASDIFLEQSWDGRV